MTALKTTLLALGLSSLSGLAMAAGNPLSVHVLNLENGIPTPGIEVTLEHQSKPVPLHGLPAHSEHLQRKSLRPFHTRAGQHDDHLPAGGPDRAFAPEQGTQLGRVHLCKAGAITDQGERSRITLILGGTGHRPQQKGQNDRGYGPANAHAQNP